MWLCTPPSLTSPSKCSRRPGSAALAKASWMTGLSPACLGDGLGDARQVLVNDAPRAEVQVADLRVAHLPVGQAHVQAAGAQAA